MARRSSRHKGERMVDTAQFYIPYGPGHPVYHMIATGSRWFDAWQFQHNLPNTRLARATGLTPERLYQLAFGGSVSRSEVEALAKVYGVQPEDIIASLPDPALLVEG
ncbi:MAG: hypothetical protein CMN63_00235 [Sphingobium sp.]|jgi:hypothetical protein|nr:hypothetical protein [Sphingobium sp.]|tara:strand:- start:725 stop:1045 length:321 start_codon:yes stop_codon:yes gene_type:complete